MGRLIGTIHVMGKPHLRVCLQPSTTQLALLHPQVTGSTWVLWVDALVDDGSRGGGDDGVDGMVVEVVPQRARFAWRFEQDDAALQCQQLLKV